MLFISYAVAMIAIIQACQMIWIKEFGSMKGHFQQCYTFNRMPLKLVWQTRVENAEEANRLELQIKGWSRKKKEL